MKKSFFGMCSAVLFFLMFPINAKTALECFETGLSLQNKKMWYEAVDSYREALDINSKYGDAWFNLAKCCYALGNYDLAVEYSDKAAEFSRNLSEIQNLKGFSLIALGKTADAKNVFSEIMKKYPNNIDARFGLAELDLLEGKVSVAQGRYKDALKRDETNRKALLSLALVSSEMGQNQIAEKYVNQALSFHSGEAEVHYLASYLASQSGNIQQAEMRARSAVQINGDFDAAYSLLANILYSQKKWNEVIDICDFRIGRNRNLFDAWYLKGRCLEAMGKYEEAISTYEDGLSVNPQDEIMRLALENIIAEEVSVEDSRRDFWGEFHYKKAQEYGKNFNSLSERYEYQRALSVAPLNSKFRQSFAKMLERDGMYELYLQQLKFIRENDKIETGIQTSEDSPARTRIQVTNDDAIESYESLMANNIASRWNVDPFYLDKTRWNIGLYYTKKSVHLFHNDLEEIIARACSDLFKGVPSASVDVLMRPVDSFGEAYRIARSENRDYFVILDSQETERTFSIDAEIYSARTGTKTTEIHVYRTGNDCIARSLQRFRQGVLDILPIRGKVLQNVQGKLLVDLGKSDGITKGCVFDIVRSGGVITKDKGTGVTYDEKNLIGSVTITDVNEEISEGDYKKRGFYDTLNAGDEIVLKITSDTKENSKGTAASDTRPAADVNGLPATESARAAEKEAIKESLKPASRESDLIHLIRSIL